MITGLSEVEPWTQGGEKECYQEEHTHSHALILTLQYTQIFTEAYSLSYDYIHHTKGDAARVCNALRVSEGRKEMKLLFFFIIGLLVT